MFNHSIINSFEKEQSSVENTTNRYIESVREDLDLDKVITTEEFKLESANKVIEERKALTPKNEVERIYDEYLTVRGRKR